MQFSSRYDYFIAFEPKGCDRNRLKELLGEEDYMKISSKLLDFHRLFLTPITTNNPDEQTKAYLADRTQQTVVNSCFLEDNRLKSKFDSILLSTDGLERSDKCEKDVRQLNNLVGIWEAVFFSGKTFNNSYFLLFLYIDWSTIEGNGKCSTHKPISDLVAQFFYAT